MSMKETRPMDASNEPRVDQIPEPILDPEIEGMLATMHRLPVRNRQAATQDVQIFWPKPRLCALL